MSSSVMSSPARGQRAATPPPRLADEDVSDHAFAAVAELYCQRVVRTSKTINVDQLPDELQLLNQLSKMNENRKKRNAAWLTLIAYRVLSTKMDDTQLENRVDEVFDALWAYDQLEYLRRQTYISLDRPDIVERLVDLEIIHPTDHSDTIRELRNKLKSADELHYRLERRFESTSLFWRQLLFMAYLRKEGYQHRSRGHANRIFPQSPSAEDACFRVMPQHYAIDARRAAKDYLSALDAAALGKTTMLPNETAELMKSLKGLEPREWMEAYPEAQRYFRDLDSFYFLVGDLTGKYYKEGMDYRTPFIIQAVGDLFPNLDLHKPKGKGKGKILVPDSAGPDPMEIDDD